MRAAIAVGAGLLVFSAATASAFAQDEHEHDQAAQHSITLSEVVSTARARSADAREARAVAEGAEAASDAAIGGYLPSVRAEANGSRVWSGSFQPNPATGNLADRSTAFLNTSLGATLRWTAWDFGRTSNAVGAAHSEAESAQARAATASNDAAKTAALLFFSALFDQELLSVARHVEKVRERHFALSHAFVEAGTRAPVEEARAKIELMKAKRDVTSYEQLVAVDRVRLATVLQMDPHEKVRFVRPAILPTLTANPKRAADQALKNRPELRAAQTSVAAQEHNVGAAKAERLPSFGLSLDARFLTSKQDDDARIFPTRSFTAMVTVNIPIFDWAVWGGRIPVARANLVAAESRSSGTHARVLQDAAESTNSLKAAMGLVGQSKLAAELAAATLTIMEARYQAGRDGPIDLFKAATADADARVALINADRALATATVEQLAATGRLEELVR